MQEISTEEAPRLVFYAVGAWEPGTEQNWAGQQSTNILLSVCGAFSVLEWTTFVCAAGTLCVDRISRTSLFIVNSEVRELGCGPQHVTLDPQLRSMLQWVAASMADIPHIQLTPDRELQQVIPLFSIQTHRFTLWYSSFSPNTFLAKSDCLSNR